MNIKPLIFIPSPRDIESFVESTSRLTFDKLWIKYYPQQEAYDVGRLWFLDRDYSHLIILPDDLLVTQEQLDLLLSWVEDPIISGWCPHLDSNGKQGNVSNKIPNPPHTATFEQFEFIPISELQGIIPVKYAGFAPTVIPRRYVEKIPFWTDFGCCVDTCFALDLEERGINQYCDTRVRTENVPTTIDMIQVGKKEKEIRFEPILL